MWLPFFPSSYPFSSFYQHLVSTPLYSLRFRLRGHHIVLSFSISLQVLFACLLFCIFLFFFPSPSAVARRIRHRKCARRQKLRRGIFEWEGFCLCCMCILYIFLLFFCLPTNSTRTRQLVFHQVSLIRHHIPRSQLVLFYIHSLLQYTI